LWTAEKAALAYPKSSAVSALNNAIFLFFIAGIGAYSYRKLGFGGIGEQE
jgi:hypothetical protein